MKQEHTTTSPRTEAIGDILARSAVTVKSIGHQRWALELSNGRSHRATAHLVGDWFMVDLPLGRSRVPSGKRQWRMLTINASIPGAPKFAIAPDRRSAALQAQIPLAADETGQKRIGPACEAMKTALDALASQTDAPERGAVPVPGAEVKSSAEGIKALCHESGWSFVESGGGYLSVQLETLDGSFYARVRPRHDGGLDLGVDMGSARGLAQACRTALAAVLLRACGAIRMVRAAVHETDERTTLRFEASLPGRTSAAEINEALSALSVACESCGREVRALQNKDIAEAYVSLSRGRSPKKQRDSK